MISPKQLAAKILANLLNFNDVLALIVRSSVESAFVVLAAACICLDLY